MSLPEKRPAIFYGWVIVAVACVSMFFVFGMRYSFSVFYVAILNQYGWSHAETALIFSLNILVYGAMSPVTGILADRFGPRKIMPLGALLLATGAAVIALANAIWHLMLLYGVLMAIGACLAGWLPYSLMISRWFVRRRGLALSISSAGFGTSFLFSPIAQLLISRIGWHWAFAVMAGCVLVVVFPLEAMFVRRQPEDLGLQPDGLPPQSMERPRSAPANEVDPVVDKEWAHTDWTVVRALKTQRFWLQYAAGFCIWGIGQSLILAHQVAFTDDIGFSTMFGALIFSLYGIFFVAGNLVSSVSDWIGREAAITIAVGSSVLGLLALLLANYTHSPWLLYLYGIFYGTGLGIASPTCVAIAADIFPGKHFGAIYGLISSAFGVAGAISPWLGGWIFDTTGSYAWAFIITLVATFAACPMLWMAAPRKVRRVPGMTRRQRAAKQPATR